MSDALWPYLIVILAGFLPNEVFRVAGALLGRRVNEQSEVFVWIRIVAVALLAAVVSKLIVAPPAVLAHLPLWLRLSAIAIGLVAFYALRRSLLLGILAGGGGSRRRCLVSWVSRVSGEARTAARPSCCAFARGQMPQ